MMGGELDVAIEAEPDSLATYIVMLPNLLAAAAAASKMLNMDLNDLLPAPLMVLLKDDWRT